jgi:hypothetical protein
MEHSEDLEKELNKKIDELSPKGSLFESIHYVDDVSINDFLNNMNREQAIYVLIESSKAAFRRGAFKLEECEALSKAIRTLVE